MISEAPGDGEWRHTEPNIILLRKAWTKDIEHLLEESLSFGYIFWKSMRAITVAMTVTIGRPIGEGGLWVQEGSILFLGHISYYLLSS